MAIISISRIQQRRGQANTGTGLPQLASGEFGWAIDTQELYIGNGAVSEGAPAVGNTRILTQLDLDNLKSPASIFGQLAYAYKASGAITNFYYLSGSGYHDGVYVDIPLAWMSGGMPPISNPIANITVSGGYITAIVLVFDGIGSSINSVFNDGGVLGAGIGFFLHVTNVTNANGTPITEAVVRTMQARLDDRVNTTDFGTIGDGINDDTSFLQNAINQLFYNTSLSSNINVDTIIADRAVLEIPPGTYRITGTIYIPSYATLVGAGSSSTIIYFDPTTPISGPVIQYINDISSIGSPENVAATTYNNQPRYITLKNIKISTGLGAQVGLQLDSVRNCLFENVSIVGNWLETFDSNSIGIKITALSNLVTSQDNVFTNISINGFGYGIYSDDDISNNVFLTGYMNDVKLGFALGTTSNGISVGQQYGPYTTKISNFNFNDIKQQAIYINFGSYNTIKDINLINVGNDGGASDVPLYPQIYITYNNVVNNIYSDRPALVSPTPPNTLNYTQFIPVVAGNVNNLSFSGYNIPILHQSLSTTISGVTTYTPTSLFKLPIPTDIVGFPSGTINYKVEIGRAHV